MNQIQSAQQTDDGEDRDTETQQETDEQPGNDHGNRRINIPLRPLMCASAPLPFPTHISQESNKCLWYRSTQPGRLFAEPRAHRRPFPKRRAVPFDRWRNSGGKRGSTAVKGTKVLSLSLSLSLSLARARVLSFCLRLLRNISLLRSISLLRNIMLSLFSAASFKGHTPN